MMPEKGEMLAPQTSFEFAPSRGNAPDVYTNNIDLTWTLYDVRLRLTEIVPRDDISDQSKPFIAQEVGAVTMSWYQAKHLRDMLSVVVEAYERVNGELKPLKLPGVP